MKTSIKYRDVSQITYILEKAEIIYACKKYIIESKGYQLPSIDVSVEAGHYFTDEEGMDITIENFCYVESFIKEKKDGSKS